MLAHAIEEAELTSLDPASYVAEWKWDGIRVQAVSASRPDGRALARLFSEPAKTSREAFRI